MGQPDKTALAHLSLRRQLVVRPRVSEEGPRPPPKDGEVGWVRLQCRSCRRELRVLHGDVMSLFGSTDGVLGCPFCDALGAGFQPLTSHDTAGS